MMAAENLNGMSGMALLSALGSGENVLKASNVNKDLAQTYMATKSLPTKKRRKPDLQDQENSGKLAQVKADPDSTRINKVLKREAKPVPASVIVATGPVGEGNVRKRRPGRRWTQGEDQALRLLVTKNGNRHWKRIAKEFAEMSGSERSDVQCLHRWNKCLKPGLLKGPWTQEEDDTIRRMIEENGGHQSIRWSVIAKMLPGRLGKQVRERWINHLDPTIIKSEWTAEEDENLYQLQKRFGNRWKWIAELIPGRSENGVKNRWHSIKPALLARKELEANGKGASPTASKDATQNASQATRTAAAAAIAAAVAATKKKSRKKKSTKSGAASPSGSIADLLSVGQSLAPGNKTNALFQPGPSDLSAVAEKAKELLRMSESYREMAKVILGSQNAGSKTSNPSSPHFNEHLQREIESQMSKQFALPPSMLNALVDGNKKDDSSSSSAPSPLASDPVLFANYFNCFASTMQLANKDKASTPDSASSEKPVSPHQMLAEVAAAAAPSKEDEKHTKP
mmetsp:Transcript_12575/g.22831  ORF Transcript_12575/g.22831 Transcript_12575/m.22831 type:complete len:511 (-) Transcript_12575:51-1583(-)